MEVLKEKAGTVVANDGIALANMLGVTDLRHEGNFMFSAKLWGVEADIATDAYNERSREVMEPLDGLFARRDDLTEAQSAGALSMARHKIISNLLESEQRQEGFDKDIFGKLVEAVRVNGRDDITFIFKDGSEIKEDTASDAAA